MASTDTTRHANFRRAARSPRVPRSAPPSRSSGRRQAAGSGKLAQACSRRCMRPWRAREKAPARQAAGAGRTNGARAWPRVCTKARPRWLTPRNHSAKTLPDPTESRGRLRHQAGHRLLKAQQGLVSKRVPRCFEALLRSNEFGQPADLRPLLQRLAASSSRTASRPTSGARVACRIVITVLCRGSCQAVDTAPHLARCDAAASVRSRVEMFCSTASPRRRGAVGVAPAISSLRRSRSARRLTWHCQWLRRRQDPRQSRWPRRLPQAPRPQRRPLA